MPLTDKRPRGILRLGLRFPILLYQLRLGGIFGKRFLLLNHVGRKSGKRYQTVIEVLRYEKQTGDYYVASGWGEKADWYLNLKSNPRATIVVGSKNLPIESVFLDEAKGAQELFKYAQQHPFAFNELTYVMTGEHLSRTEESCRRLAKSVPIICFQADRK